MMRQSCWLLGIVLAGVLAFAGAGCKKDQPPPAPTSNGVTVDIPKLRVAFAAASPDAMKTVSQIAMSVRYTRYEKALEQLDTLANDPGTTEAQKKLLAQIMDQVKKAAEAAQAAQPAQPAQ